MLFLWKNSSRRGIIIIIIIVDFKLINEIISVVVAVSSTPERLMLSSGVTVWKHQKHNKVLIQKNKCLYFRLPMQTAIIIIIIITVKHSGTVKKIQLYIYIEKGWLRWAYKNNYHTQLKRISDQRTEGLLRGTRWVDQLTGSNQ